MFELRMNRWPDRCFCGQLLDEQNECPTCDAKQKVYLGKKNCRVRGRAVRKMVGQICPDCGRWNSEGCLPCAMKRRG